MNGGRIGYVVATHPEDHSVDLVMADDGARLVGVQVATMNGSTRTGSVDLPAVPAKADKWDITQLTGQDMKALVDYYGRTPVVTGFLYPQINQILSTDPKLRYDRHQSDVISSIDGDGNIQLVHPCGAYVRIGESPDLDDMAGKNADANSAVDRNTGRRAFFRLGLGGNAVVVTMTPDGDMTLAMTKDLSITVGGNAQINVTGTTALTSTGAVTVQSDASATVTAPQVTLDTPDTLCTGNLVVQGMLAYQGGMTGSGGNAQLTGDMNIDGNQIVSGNINLSGNLAAAGTVTDGDGDGGA